MQSLERKAPTAGYLVVCLIGLASCAYPTKTVVGSASSPNKRFEAVAFQLGHPGLPIDEGGLRVEIHGSAGSRRVIIEQDDWHTEFLHLEWKTNDMLFIAACGSLAGDLPNIGLYEVGENLIAHPLAGLERMRQSETQAVPLLSRGRTEREKLCLKKITLAIQADRYAPFLEALQPFVGR